MLNSSVCHSVYHKFLTFDVVGSILFVRSLKSSQTFVTKYFNAGCKADSGTSEYEERKGESAGDVGHPGTLNCGAVEAEMG